MAFCHSLTDYIMPLPLTCRIRKANVYFDKSLFFSNFAFII